MTEYKLTHSSRFHGHFARMLVREQTKIFGAAFAAYNAEGCEYITLSHPDIDKRLKMGQL